MVQSRSGKSPVNWPRYRLTRAWQKTGWVGKAAPRPYDLRHNFATCTLMRWINEKRDVMALTPYLNTYMGHVTPEETLYYVHLLPESLKSSPGIDWDMLRGIYRTEDGLLMKIKGPALFGKINVFFTEYLPVVRRESPNTITAYRYTINIYFEFLEDMYHIKLWEAGLADFTQRNLLDFMDWLQVKRKNAVSTVNLRLVHMRKLCRCLMEDNIL